MTIAPLTEQLAMDECFRCGYSLHGIADEQPCPECGLLAQRSRRATDELHDTRPRWLASISRGTNLILLAIALAFVWPFVQSTLFEGVVTPIVRYYSSAGRLLPMWVQRIYLYVPLIGFEVAALALLVGALLLTRREQYPPADEADRRWRVTLRIVAAAPLLALACQHVYQERWLSGRMSGRGWVQWSWLQDAAGWIAMVGCLPLPALLFFRLRGLAKRARSAHLAEHCAIVGIGASAALLYLIGAYYVLEHADDWGWGTNWAGRSQGALLITLIIAVAAFLFALWSLYLLVRFAIAFRRASRQLRHKWKRDDRAAPA
jgi:hypothetical protein